MDNGNGIKNQLTRKAVISVLIGEEDITDGAEFWDGTDFIAWGASETTPYNKKGQNKFKEYKFIEIPKSVYDKYLNTQPNNTTYNETYGIIATIASGKSIFWKISKTKTNK